MASPSSPVVRALIRDGKSVANIFVRVRTANLTTTETVQNTGRAIRSLLRFNQTPACQYPVFSENFPVMQFSVRFIEQEAVSERIGKAESAHGKRVVDNEDADSREEETDFDEEEFDDLDIDEDEVFEDMDDDDDDDEEEEDDEYTRKKK